MSAIGGYSGHRNPKASSPLMTQSGHQRASRVAPAKLVSAPIKVFISAATMSSVEPRGTPQCSSRSLRTDAATCRCRSRTAGHPSPAVLGRGRHCFGICCHDLGWFGRVPRHFHRCCHRYAGLARFVASKIYLPISVICAQYPLKPPSAGLQACAPRRARGAR
jgi:hypothetical protein